MTYTWNLTASSDRLANFDYFLDLLLEAAERAHVGIKVGPITGHRTD